MSADHHAPSERAPMTSHPELSALLLDIEGTTTSIAFVYETLFPYARVALPAFVEARWDDPRVRDAAALMGADATPGAATERALALMDADVKDTGLKALQGMVWREGFESGDLRGHVFEDVAPVLRALHGRGVTLAIYSSGSVEAQKLLFGYSVAGDLGALMSGFFDTTTGPKKAPESYAAIAAALALPPAAILFLSDNPAELEAATAAGLRAMALARPGNAPLPPGLDVPTLTDFAPLLTLDWRALTA